MSAQKDIPMNRKVFRSGNSLVLSLPEEVIRHLGVQAGDEVQIDLEPGKRQVILTPNLPIASAGVDEEFHQRAMAFIHEHRELLERLAES
jgi:putative addiction module antidote